MFILVGRRGISERDGALLATAVLEDVGLVTEEKKSLVVSR